MKKIISITVVVVGILLVVFGVSAKVKEAAAVSIIGGADGPTAVFVAGKIGDGLLIGAIFVGIVFFAAGVLIYRKVRKK